MDNLTWGRAPLPKTDKDLYFWFRLKDQPGTAFIAGLYDMGDHHEWALATEVVGSMTVMNGLGRCRAHQSPPSVTTIGAARPQMN